jgi:predicted Zn-dependent protease
MASRGTLGFATDTATTYDLIAGLDSAFSIVEESNPDCASQTGPYRQQKGWVDLVNHAIELGNAAGQTDSAVYLAKRSLQLYKNAPYGYMVLAKASAEKNQPKDAINYYKEAATYAAKDTSAAMQDQRRGVLQTIGAYASELYDGASDEDKAYFMKEAKEAFEALAKDPGTKFADAARNGQARLAQLSGDTAAIKASYADQLANPGAFSYSSLMSAAVTAARANQTKDAIKLFEAAKTANPFHRDVLYNLSRLYLLDSAYTKGLPLARQLVSVDPSNPDNYQLIAIAYASIKSGYDKELKAAEAKAKTYGQRANAPRASAAVVKANIDSAAKINPLIKAYQDSGAVAIDSALKYQAVMTKLPAKVVFTEFTPTDAKTTIGGTLTNQTDAARAFNFKIEFIDKAGNVVSSQDVSLPSVAPHTAAQFNATGTGAGIVAFRYPAIP